MAELLPLTQNRQNYDKATVTNRDAVLTVSWQQVCYVTGRPCPWNNSRSLHLTSSVRVSVAVATRSRGERHILKADKTPHHT